MWKAATLVTLILALVWFLAPGATADIVGSKHDFSGASWSHGEICLPCHTAHGADTTRDAPLWNHAVDDTQVYTQYTSPTDTLNATDIDTDQSGISGLCLSCHDGTIALDAFGPGPNRDPAYAGTATIDDAIAAGSTPFATWHNLGTDLSDMHPVGFTFDNAVFTADGELHDPSTLGDFLYGPNKDQVECSSCHDVHNGANEESLLRMSNAASALCLSCHDK
jgi:predicted CXXCH cytochrome family protein